MIETTKKVRLHGEASKEKRRAYARAYTKKYRATHPPKDRREYLKEWGKKRLSVYHAKRKELDAIKYRKNREKILSRNAEFHRSKKEEIAKRKEQWRRQNYERVHAKEMEYKRSSRGRTADDNCKNRRRAQMFACETRATAAEVHALKQRQKCCYYCGSVDRLTVDHFFPLKKQGQHAIENLVMACKSCNSRKSALSPTMWSKRSGFIFAHPKNPAIVYGQASISPASL